MWIKDSALEFQAEAAILTHVKGWLNHLVTRAQVLLTDTSYNIVITEDLQDQLNLEFQNTMLLKSTNDMWNEHTTTSMEVDSVGVKEEHDNYARKGNQNNLEEGSELSLTEKELDGEKRREIERA